ncbi:MAG: nucleotide exchange factor GrpE [Deltaproteobacteria bacterium]|nr:nucleotide exchange factor GrpE [Deltaproteobacteria bacterium]
MEKKTKVDQLKDMLKAKKEAEEKAAAAEAAQKDPEQPSLNSEEMSAQIKAAEDEAKAHYDKLLRVMAEFENFKKRIERERIEHLKYSNQSLILDLLPVLDDFDRIISHIPKDADASVASIADGVKLTQNHFMTALAKHGLTPLEPSVGTAFDPQKHEAIAHIEDPKQPEGNVAVEHRRGWKLHDRIIRPSTVAVAKPAGDKK